MLGALVGSPPSFYLCPPRFCWPFLEYPVDLAFANALSSCDMNYIQGGILYTDIL